MNIKEFLRPTKVTWISFGCLLSLNILSVVAGIIAASWTLISVPLVQMVWLYSTLYRIGADVGGNGIFAKPNLLGWLAVAVGSLITLLVYYVFASTLSRRYHRKHG